MIETYIARIDAAFEELRRHIEEYRPDALIVIGDDQDDIEDCSNCCNPIHIVTHKDDLHKSVQVFVDAEDEQIY